VGEDQDQIEDKVRGDVGSGFRLGLRLEVDQNGSQVQAHVRVEAGQNSPQGSQRANAGCSPYPYAAPRVSAQHTQ
jgi:hypothetical protein